MHLLDIFFPRRCVSCGKIGVYFCNGCIKKIDFIDKPICPVCEKPAIDGFTHPKCRSPYGLDGMYALAHFKGPIKRAIHLLKYNFVTDMAEPLCDFLVKGLPNTLPDFDLLIPVPLHLKKERERGFNQSLVLTKIISKKLNIPYCSSILKRIRLTAPQADLSGKERRNNIKGAFCCTKSTILTGKTIGLIDDVATTRSTLMECCLVLKRLKVKKVWGVVLAHG